MKRAGIAIVATLVVGGCGDTEGPVSASVGGSDSVGPGSGGPGGGPTGGGTGGDPGSGGTSGPNGTDTDGWSSGNTTADSDGGVGSATSSWTSDGSATDGWTTGGQVTDGWSTGWATDGGTGGRTSTSGPITTGVASDTYGGVTGWVTDGWETWGSTGDWVWRHYLAVGDAGQYLTSEDGLVWSPGYPEVESDIMDVAHLDDEAGYAAVTEDGVILGSDNGEYLWGAYQGDGAALSGVAAGDEKMMAVGPLSVLMSQSRYYWEWSAGVVPAGFETMPTVAAGAGRYVVAGGTFMGRYRAYWTEDGYAWQVATEDWGDPVALSHAAGEFWAVAGAELWRSADGDGWSLAQTFDRAPDAALAYGAGLYVLAFSGDDGTATGVRTSLDGETWSPMATELDLREIRDLEYLDDKFVMVGSTEVDGQPVGAIWISYDGVDWQIRASGAGLRLNAVTY